MLIIYHLGLIILLVKIAWLDYRQQLIADKDIITGLLWVFTWQLCYFQDAASSALGALYSAIIYGFYFAAIRYYTKKELYGAGDVTLNILLGAATGFPECLYIHITGNALIVLAALITIFCKLLPKNTTIALAPYYISSYCLFLYYKGGFLC